MIKNSKQAAITRTKLEQLKLDLTAYQQTQETLLHPVRYKLGLKAFEGMINDLSEQLAQYERVTRNPVNQFAGFKAPQLTDLLTQVRLAKDMSQKALAEKIGVQEQQIQRYEQDDYAKASWNRIVEVYHALDLEIKLASFEVEKNSKQPTPAKPALYRKWSTGKVNRASADLAIRTTKNTRSLFQFAK